MPRRNLKPTREQTRTWQQDKNAVRDARFVAAMLRLDAGRPVQEYGFHSERKWRFDFAWPQERVAVEIQGGGWKGRHSRPGGFSKDCEKTIYAAAAGWVVIPITTGQLRDERLVSLIAQAINARRIKAEIGSAEPRKKNRESAADSFPGA